MKTTVLHATRYDRSAVRAGIVHVGFGAFHRAHQAVYVDDYMDATGDLNWGIAAVNLRASESMAFNQAVAMPNGYVLKTTTPQGDTVYRRVRPHVHSADWSQDATKAEALLANADVHAVTITVTESGYYLNADGSLNTKHPVVAAELRGAAAQSVYGYLSAALSRRAETTDQPITVMCCDNIRANGKMLRRNFLAYLDLTEQRVLGDWVSRHATFPCSMVDRITPRATDALAEEVRNQFPDDADTAIHGEAFTQWVLENDFAGPMPDLSKSGVQIVADVDPFEEAKIRILNGGHTGLAYLGALAGHKTFDAAMKDPRLRTHFDAFEADEVLPGLTLELPFDKHHYTQQIAQRFCNAAIADQLERICMDGYSKMPLYIRPTMAACLAQGITPIRSFDCVASWAVFARRSAAGQSAVTYHEPYWNDLQPLLEPGREESLARQSQLWGDLPDKFPQFVPGIVAAIQQMEQAWPA